MGHPRILITVLFAVATVGAARAEDCPPAQLVTSVDMKIADDGRIYVPVRLNDAKKSMLVDTGGFFSEVTRQAADELRLPTRHIRLELIGVGGDTTNMATRASFLLGNLRADATDFMVIPDANGFATDVPDVAGLLAPNLFHSYDLDIDFSTMKLSLYSQQHCEGKAVRWPGAMAVMPMRIDASDHIQIPVQLDGQNLTAILDTGATRSVLDVELAGSMFGLTPGDAQSPEVGRMMRSPQSKTYAHRFKSLALGGIAVADPEVRLIPDLMRHKLKDSRDNIEGGSRLSASIEKPGFGDMILGMNVIRQWHVYISYKEQKLYLTRSPVIVSDGNASETDQTAAVRAQQTTDPIKPPDVHPH
jgi:predicted aspartyl protease